MTDEEMAKDYAEHNQGKYTNDFGNLYHAFLAGSRAIYKRGGEMSKEDMMNRISFALKDPVLQMGFEVICSKLARLEKENTELKEQIEKMKCCENCRHYSHTYGHCYSYGEYQNCKSLSNWRLAEC